MRTLKKSLALVLVVALVLSFGVIGASASDFTDVKDSNYTEAIDVLSGIGVLNGMTATTFEPTGTLTRAQAAKIVAYLKLGPTNAELIKSASSQKFTDVPTTHWAAGYIEYCANLGVIAGVGDNKFDPEGKLTTAAFTKMLLVALGYNASTEGFTGESWAIKVAALAVTAGVKDSGIVISASTSCTREQAAQLAFKALTAKTVEYTGGSSMTIGGVPVTTGAVRSYVANEDTTYVTGGDPDDYMQFCESSFPTLKLTKDSVDSFGRPGHTWKYSKTTIGTYTDEPVLSYTTAVDPDDVLEDIDAAGYSVATKVNIFTNGNEQKDVTVPAAADLEESYGGNGTLIELYANSDDKIDTIVVVTTWLAEVTDYTADKTSTSKDERALTLTYNDDIEVTATPASTEGFDDVYAAAVKAVDAGDTYYVIINPKGDGAEAGTVLTIAEPETFTGKVTKKAGSTYTIDGDTYKAAMNFDGTITVGNSATFYTDAYGYIIGSTDVAVATKYAYVIAATTVTDALEKTDVYKAKLLLTDATTVTVETKSDAADFEGDIVKYSINSSDQYVLTDVSSVPVDGQALKITKGVSKFTFNDTYYANSATIFLVGTTNESTKKVTYKAFTGIKNVPSYDADAVTGAIVASDTAVAKVVFMLDPGVGVVDSSKIVFYAGGATKVVTEDDTYYEADVVVSGKLVEDMLFADLDGVEVGVYSGYTTDEDGYATLGSSAGTEITAITKASNGIIGLNSEFFTLADDVVVYTYTATGTLAASTASSIKANESAEGFYVLNSSNEVAAIFLAK